jgi:hypothetical protein
VVSELILTFKKVILLSMLMVMLGVTVVYALGLELKIGSSTRLGPTSPTFVPPGMQHPLTSELLIYGYDGDNQSSVSSSFVQASVTINGTEYPNVMTSADPQNPLRVWLMPGQYSVSGMYGSAIPQNVTVNLTTSGTAYDAFLNFGSSPLPPLGQVAIYAWYSGIQPSGDFESLPVRASVTIAGPQEYNGTTSTDLDDPLILTVTPGDYLVFGMYGSAIPQNETVSVAAGSFIGVALFFGDATFSPPP